MTFKILVIPEHFFFLLFEAETHIASISFQLVMYLRIIVNSLFHIPSTGTTGMLHHSWLNHASIFLKIAQ